MSRLLVTGGCGFIGSHLVDRLIESGHTVRVLDNLSTGKRSNIPNNVEVIEGCISDPELVREVAQGVDGIFHLAAIASVQRSCEEWLQTHRTNQTGAINVFEAARHAGQGPVPVVYASSAAVYGDTASPFLGEFDQIRPLTAYGADKYGCELHGRVASLVHGVPTVGLRFFNVFGPRQDPNSPYSGVISIFMEKVSNGEQIRIFGDGEQSRDFIYVSDIVKALCLAMDRADPYGLVLNACTGRSTSINDLARLVMQAVGRDVPVRYNDARPGDIRSSVGSVAFARRKLNFEAEWSLIEGLRQLAGRNNLAREAA
jgi:UDP-glucose 4-epimerase